MYGADAVRLYILLVGPADQDMAWTEEGGDRTSAAGGAGLDRGRRVATRAADLRAGDAGDRESARTRRGLGWGVRCEAGGAGNGVAAGAGSGGRQASATDDRRARPGRESR